jgi:hypothetical protein
VVREQVGTARVLDWPKAAASALPRIGQLPAEAFGKDLMLSRPGLCCDHRLRCLPMALLHHLVLLGTVPLKELVLHM